MQTPKGMRKHRKTTAYSKAAKDHVHQQSTAVASSKRRRQMQAKGIDAVVLPSQLKNTSLVIKQIM